MASDFYEKTKYLFEEFKKRELQYLNAERATRCHFPDINEKSMPVQEYLEKLNKREKENEEAYLGLMHSMKQLDHHTESISEKLRKLESLRLSMSSKAPVWPYRIDTYDTTLHSSPNNFKTDNMLHNNVLHLNQYKAAEHSYTQTSLASCENCQFPLNHTEKPLHALFTNDPLNTNPSLPSSAVGNETAPETAPETSVPLQEVICKSGTALDKYKEENLQKMSFVSKISEETPLQNETLLDKHQSFSTSASLSDNTLENKNNTAYDKQLLKTDIPTDTDRKEIVDVERMDKQIPTVVDFKENIEEKINILNSTKNDIDLHASVASVTLDNSDIAVNSIVVEDFSGISLNENISQIESEGEILPSRNNLQKSSVIHDGQSDKQSESSISIEGAPSPSIHSANISAVSDSDSYDEKEHLKESAAYQALLGNVPVTKKIQKTSDYLESESEDEAERTLANATRKSSNIPTTKVTVPEEKPDDVSNENRALDFKAKNEPRKSISLGKSQQLSKNTRKVLGLDTSSGSEGEVRVQAKTSQKIEEDSDEFDFYD